MPTPKTQGPLFLLNDEDLQIVDRALHDEPLALIVNYLLRLTAIDKSKVNYKVNIEHSQEIKSELKKIYQKHKSAFSFTKTEKQPIKLTDCTQKVIREAYRNRDTRFLCQLCEERKPLENCVIEVLHEGPKLPDELRKRVNDYSPRDDSLITYAIDTLVGAYIIEMKKQGEEVVYGLTSLWEDMYSIMKKKI